MALGRRVWVEQGIFRVYPNMFVVLVAGSGRCRKSTSIGMLQRVCDQVTPAFNFISQKITNEELIARLARINKPRPDDPTGPKYSEAYAVIDELSTFLDKKTYESGIASTLIKLFDCGSKFDYSTKTKGSYTVHNPCLGLLGASTLEWIRNAIPSDAIGGGLTSRIIFVYIDQAPKPVARIEYPPELIDLEHKLARTLEVIATVPKGPAILTPEAWDQVEAGYEAWHNSNGGNHKMFLNPTLSGYASRRYVHVMTVAMLLSVSANPTEQTVTVTGQDITNAEGILAAAEQHMPRIMYLINATERGFATEVLYEMIRQCPDGVSREILMSALTNKLSVRDFDEIISTLKAGGRIVSVPTDRGLVYAPSVRRG